MKIYTVIYIGDHITINGRDYTLEEFDQLIYDYRARIVAGEEEENSTFEELIEYHQACMVNGKSQ